MFPTSAHAVYLDYPVAGQSTTSRPFFDWVLESGEASSFVEVSPSPALEPSGAFADYSGPLLGPILPRDSSYQTEESEAFKPGTGPPDSYSIIGVADADGMPMGVSPDTERTIIRPGTGGLY